MSPAAPAASAEQRRCDYWAKAPASCWPTSTRRRSTRASQAIVQKFGRDSAVGIALDVTDEASVVASFHESVLAYGGIDIVVSNAGIASASPVEDTSLALWQKNMDVLATGYFLVAREAFRLMQRQQCGGAIVFVASKNGLAASAGASAYCAAKASEIHLARCLALEGAPHGIRVNTVNPDAVLRGSKIWAGEWRQQRAASNKVTRRRTRRGLSAAIDAEAFGVAGGHRRGRSISSPAIFRPNRPATSSMSTPATRRRSRAETPIVGRQ